MKNLYLAICLLLLFLSHQAFSDPTAQYPASENPEEFSQQVEAFITSRSISGNGLRDIYNRTNENSLLDDKRDWETPLARMIEDPGKYGIPAASMAFEASFFRKTSGDPRIVQATIRLFDAELTEAEARYQKMVAESGAAVPVLVRGGMPSFTAKMLASGSPVILERMLDYFVSGEDAHLDLISQNTPNHVAAALRAAGDGRHLEKAKTFSQKMREMGKTDIADDLDRSIVRIEKDEKRTQAARNSGIASPNAGSIDNKMIPDQSDDLSMPWIIGSIAALLAIGGVALSWRKI